VDKKTYSRGLGLKKNSSNTRLRRVTMFNLIITTIEWVVVLVVLAAFIIGAWRHTVAETLGDPLLVDPSPNAKAKGYLRLAGKVLWHILVPVAMIGGILLKFGALAYATPVVVINRKD
jgi:hypothetical protein